MTARPVRIRQTWGRDSKAATFSYLGSQTSRQCERTCKTFTYEVKLLSSQQNSANQDTGMQSYNLRLTKEGFRFPPTLAL